MAINFPTSPAFHVWQPAAWLRVEGGDAATFLQGQFTNELRGLPVRGAVYGLWLNLKGRVLADSFVLRGSGADEFWVGSYFSSAAVMGERLESYVIADDVTITDATPEWAGVSLLGAGTWEALTAKPVAGFVFRGRRERTENVEWIFPAAEIAAVRARLQSGRELDVGEMEHRRITAGIPAVPADVGLGDLPNEGGLEADAISYTKGCYLGQEVMARLKSMGRVRRRLLRVAAAEENIPARLAALFSGSRKIGELRSAARDPAGGWVGLAMLSLLPLTPDSVLSLAADGPPVIKLLDAP
ncbi:MAG: folate-binding protein [Opitutus sp.]|nr:folate-binding protein [Opitutus sp.]